VHAIAPLLVAPNTAVQQEMAAVFSTMQAVVQQQLILSGQGLADLQEEANELTWSQHYEQLLWDMQTILDATAAKPGCLPTEVAAGVLTGVLEFLGLHGCWCSISWLLAEATRSKLLNHAKAAAAQRLQETQRPFAGQAASDATGAMCAGFMMDLAASPVPVRPSTSSSSTSPVTVSSSRRVLSALSAAMAGTHVSTIVAGAGSSCHGPTRAELYQAGSSTAFQHQLPGLVAHNSSSSALRSSKLSSGSSFQSCRSVSAGSPAVTHPGRPSGQHAAAWCSSSCQAWNVALAVTAVSLVLLLLVLNHQQMVPCQTAAGEQGNGQAEGCLLTYEPVVGSGSRVNPSASVAHLAYDILLYAPFMALLLLTVSVASKVCLVL
jgi:hypothetical protein